MTTCHTCHELLRAYFTTRNLNINAFKANTIREPVSRNSLDKLTLKLKLHYFDLISPWYWEILRAEWKESVKGWDVLHHLFNDHELGQTPGDGEGQGGLVCCSWWSRKDLGKIGQLNNNNLYVESCINRHFLYIHLKKIDLKYYNNKM